MSDKPKRIENENSRMIAGALFDFLGFLTTGEEIVLSAHHNATEGLAKLQAWASMRGLSLEEADVMGWQKVVK